MKITESIIIFLLYIKLIKSEKFDNFCLSERTFGIIYKTESHNLKPSELYDAHISKIEVFKTGGFLKIKWGRGEASIKRLKINSKTKNRIDKIYNDVSNTNLLHKENGILDLIICVRTEKYIYEIYEPIYISLSNKIKSVKFQQKRNPKERLLNYKQLAIGILNANKAGISLVHISPVNIMVLDNEFTNLKLTHFTESSSTGSMLDISYYFTNAPEINMKKKLLASPKQDMYGLGMTIAVLELADREIIYKYRRLIFENYKKNLYRKVHNDIFDRLAKKIGRSKHRAPIYIQFFRWFTQFFVKVDIIDYCVDLVCLIEVATTYSIDRRPTASQFLERLDIIIESYNQDDMIFNKKVNTGKNIVLI